MRSAYVLAIALLLPAPSLAQVTGAQRPGMPQPPAPDAKGDAGTAVLKGRVTAADTGRPLRRAQVRVTAPELKGQSRQASSDINGYWEVGDLPAGRYSISVSRGGYLAMQHGQQHFGEPGAPLQVGDGETYGNLDIVLPRASTISGRLTDESGQPVSGATMYAMQVQFFQGQRRLVPISGPGITTDDTGQFRVQAVPPGEVYLAASSRETWVDDKDPAITYGFSPTYYPGTAVLAEARRIKVGVGQDIASMDFALVPSRAAKISGTALGSDGAPLRNGSVGLSQEVRGPAAISMSMMGSTRIGADGSWTLERALPGDYILRVSGQGPDGKAESLTSPITVSGQDIGGLVLAVDSGVHISGRIEADEGLTLPAGSLRILVTPVVPGTASLTLGADQSAVHDDRTFSRAAPSGLVNINVLPLPPGWAIKAIEIAGENHAGRPVELRGGTRVDGVRIVVTSRFPTVAGMLTDDRGAPTAGTVLLFSAEESLWLESTGDIRSARPDQSGQYRFTAVRPGEYLLAAVEAVPSWQIFDPEFLGALRANATRVTIREGQDETRNVRVR